MQKKIPYQTRLQPELLKQIRASAKIHNEGNVNREIRDLLKIGLKERKKNEDSN